jgi:hypothetical protein
MFFGLDERCDIVVVSILGLVYLAVQAGGPSIESLLGKAFVKDSAAPQFFWGVLAGTWKKQATPSNASIKLDARHHQNGVSAACWSCMPLWAFAAHWVYDPDRRLASRFRCGRGYPAKWCGFHEEDLMGTEATVLRTTSKMGSSVFTEYGLLHFTGLENDIDS